MKNAFMTDTDVNDDFYYYFTTFSYSLSTGVKIHLNIHEYIGSFKEKKDFSVRQCLQHGSR